MIVNPNYDFDAFRKSKEAIKAAFIEYVLTTKVGVLKKRIVRVSRFPKIHDWKQRKKELICREIRAPPFQKLSYQGAWLRNT